MNALVLRNFMLLEEPEKKNIYIMPVHERWKQKCRLHIFLWHIFYNF